VASFNDVELIVVLFSIMQPHETLTMDGCLHPCQRCPQTHHPGSLTLWRQPGVFGPVASQRTFLAIREVLSVVVDFDAIYNPVLAFRAKMHVHGDKQRKPSHLGSYCHCFLEMRTPSMKTVTLTSSQNVSLSLGDASLVIERREVRWQCRSLRRVASHL
jgi:hypothetical protein